MTTTLRTFEQKVITLLNHIVDNSYHLSSFVDDYYGPYRKEGDGIVFTPQEAATLKQLIKDLRRDVGDEREFWHSIKEDG